MVFTWHFIHVGNGHTGSPTIFPLSLLTQGHTGVALFMTLSGYLFAKLLDGKKINYVLFIRNRLLRLAPLLIIVIILVGFQYYALGLDLYSYAKSIRNGLIMPSLPNGGWSITSEFHFYILLPFLLLLSKKSKYLLILVLILAIINRIILYQIIGQIQTLSFLTIVGRIDQFLLGIIAFQFRGVIAGKNYLVFSILFMFAAFYWFFDLQGGFYNNPSYPSPSLIWIYMPTLEGLAYAAAISWYDNSFKHSTGRFSRFIALIGAYSYSIYLLHFFIVFNFSYIINRYFIDLSNIYLALLFSPVCFLIMVPIGHLSYRCIELPFFKFRTRYIVPEEPTTAPQISAEEGCLKNGSIALS